MGRVAPFEGTVPGVIPSREPQQQARRIWTELMDTCGVDLFACDENCSGSGNLLGTALRLPGDASRSDLLENHYAALHDEFLESLLHEQSKAAKEGIDAKAREAPPSPENPPSVIVTAKEPRSEASSQKKRAIRLHRRGSGSPPHHHHHHHIPRKAPQRLSSTSTLATAATVELDELARSSFPEPHHYLHIHCRMQKDKGKGEPVGSTICAKGWEACLDKLRSKMRLLTDVVLDEEKGPATMKRRKARVSEDYDTFTETRSLIELRMGFLSMTYGVLLRWDTGRTGKVTLVVLRKMCQDSFYPLINHVRTIRPKWVSNGPAPPVSRVLSLVGDKEAILQRQDGTEVALVEPPYRVARPATFEPSVLRASVLYAKGLSRRSNWTVKLTYEATCASILLSWDSDQRCLMPTLGEPMKHTVGNLNMSSLEVKLFEHRLRRRSYRRLISTMQVPLNNLHAQNSARVETSRVVIPCKHDADSSVALGLSLTSDYGNWLSKELEVRHKEDSQRPVFYSLGDENEENEDPWDWIYSICTC